MDFAYIVAGYYLLFCAAVAGLILRLMRNCPLDDEEEEFSMPVSYTHLTLPTSDLV